MQDELHTSPYEISRDDWQAVLPDGSAYNHWGGKAISERLIGILNLQPWHSVLDLCCGEGGTLSLLPKVRRKCGIDISLPAVNRCRRNQTGGQFVHGDAHSLPFEGETFDRVFSQDADAWMRGNASVVLGEVARVIKRNGVFVLQNYVRTAQMPVSAETQTKEILRMCGFRYTEVLAVEKLEFLLRRTGLTITAMYDLHDVYMADNARMLSALSSPGNPLRSLQRLLEWETKLFENRWWTGIMFVAQRE